MHVRPVHLGVLLVGVGISACDEGTSPSAPSPPRSSAAAIAISPSTDTIAVIGARADFAAVVLDSMDRPVAGNRLSWASLNPEILRVDSKGRATGLATGLTGITATSAAVADTAWVWIAPLPVDPLASQTPGDLKVTAGALTARAQVQDQPVRAFDGRYAAAELATYTAWIAGGRRGADGSSHYGALRSRYQWSLRNGLPVGPAAPITSVYAHGVEMTRAFLSQYSVPNGFKVAPHNNTAMPDVEMLYVLEGDADALAHLKGLARLYGAAYGENYFDLTGSNSDPRSSAILLQTLSVAARLEFPYTGRASWGSTWKEAAAYMVERMAGRIGEDGTVVSRAHKTTGQGDEAYFMNAMLAAELLHWHGFVEPRPAWVALAKRIMDHLVDQHRLRAAECLPYLSSARRCAPDLAGFYVWPALVLWQETGDDKFREFAIDHLKAAEKAYIVPAKAFNQAYSTGAQSTEALLAKASWH